MTEEGADYPENDDNHSTTTINVLARQYAEYIQVDSSTQIGQFDDSIEEMLTRLDEFCGLVDIIRSDTSLCLQKTLPQIYIKSKEMEAIFSKIDKLEAFVALVRQNISILEGKVDKAEDDMGSLSSIKKVLNSFSLPSFLSSKKNNPPSENMPQTFDPPEVFRTSDFLPSAAGGATSYGRIMSAPGHTTDPVKVVGHSMDEKPESHKTLTSRKSLAASQSHEASSAGIPYDKERETGVQSGQSDDASSNNNVESDESKYPAPIQTSQSDDSITKMNQLEDTGSSGYGSVTRDPDSPRNGD